VRDFVHGPHRVKDVVLVAHAQFRDAVPGHNIHLCNTQAASCSPGVHETPADLEALVALAARAPAPAR